MDQHRANEAVWFLRGYVAALSTSGRTQLPTVRELAASAHMSRSSIQRAVNTLAEEGVVRTRQGSGTQLTRATTGSSSPAPGCPWRIDDVCATIERDILSGVLVRGTRLPSRKELMLRYGVSYRTLRRSLERLVAERTLTPERRSYRVCPLHPLPTQTLYLFVGGTITRRPPPGNTQTIERECARANLKLVVVRHVWRGTRMEFDHPTHFSKEQLKHIIGFMVWTMGYHDTACAEVLGIVHQFGKPVGIFDERQDYHQKAIPFANRLTRCVVVAQREDEGAALGRYLLDRGHRKVLYVSLPGFDFNDIRYLGLCSIFTRAGLADGVTGDSLPSKLSSRRSGNTGRTNSIDKAIEKRGVTAIVGYNDTAALAVLRYLRERGVAVPGRVSVVGFDDSPESSLEGLTSYNFNSQEAISLLVGHILSDPARRMRRAPSVDLVQGYVTQRASSGPAPS